MSRLLINGPQNDGEVVSSDECIVVGGGGSVRCRAAISALELPDGGVVTATGPGEFGPLTGRPLPGGQ